jgi:Prokaryotic homologs of the JAB domain
MTELAEVAELRVPSKVMIDGYEFMRSAGRMHLEGMVLWAGKQDEQVFTVTELIVPKQKGLRTADGVCAVVDADELARLNMHLYRSRLELVAQVHTHPTEAYHSSTDDKFAIATTIGCYSIVVPNFAVVNYALSECAVYRLDAAGAWLEVDESTAPNRIVVA